MRFPLSILLLAPLACSSPSCPAEAPPAPAVSSAPSETIAHRAIFGRVLSAEGQPVSGATVTVSPHSAAWDYKEAAPSSVVQSGPDGRFRAGPLESGHHGLSARAPDGSIHFGEAMEVGSSDAEITLRMGAPSASVQGTVIDEGGRPVPQAEVRIIQTRLPLDSALYIDDIALLPRTGDGRYRVKIAPGEYTVAAAAPGFVPMAKSFTAGSTPLLLDLRLESAPDAAMRQAAIAWAKQTGLPLQTVEAGRGFADLQPLESVLKDVRVVALGEATHGTREFFQLKHRMFEFLVTRMGFTVFAIEAPFTRAWAIHDFVLTGQGDPAAALAGLNVWPWQTEEILALIHWMRAYNASPEHPKKLAFYGVDMQAVHQEATDVVLDYLARVDPVYAAALKEPLTPLTSPNPRTVAWLGEKERKALRQSLDGLVQQFGTQRKRYERRSGPQEWARVLQHLRVLRQSAELDMTRDESLRDRAMADNLRWVLEQKGPGAKAVVWAHNNHVVRGNDASSHRSMGSHLQAVLGESLYVFGFAFHQGTFRAINGSRNPAPGRHGIVSFTVPEAPEDSIDAVLAAAGAPLLALDLRALPRTGPAYEWWKRAQRTRDIGALFSDEGYPMSRIRALEAYDGLLFVENTSAARPVQERVTSTAP